MTEKRRWWLNSALLLPALGLPLLMTQAQGQSASEGAAPSRTYQPKFSGDPARSESEAEALGYMRVVLRAQRTYKQRHGRYAGSLAQLAGTGSFTKRMAQTTDRGDYTVSFRPHRSEDQEGFVLSMTPKQIDAERRSFYAAEDGIIRGDDQKAADADSPRLK